MARISANAGERVYRINRWLGVNQAPEGDALLNYGEAADMRNFKITAGGALQKRGGSKNVAGLMNGYVASVDEETDEILLTEVSQSEAEFTMYPSVAVDSVGNLTLTGTPVTVDSTNAASYVGYYYQNAAGIHKFAGLVQKERL